MPWLTVPLAGIALWIVRAAWIRLRLSRAKHRSLTGHANIARRLARLVPFYEYGEDRFYRCDGAPAEVAGARRAGFERLCAYFAAHSTRTLVATGELETSISDAAFTNAYRVPFQFRNHVLRHLHVGGLADASSGPRLRDLDGNWAFDLGGSYGVNVFGHEFYKDCLAAGFERVKELGAVLGPYHPLIADNAARLRAISGLDEVSFHMSGTEAVMQAVRLARYHTGRTKLVRFCGAYHGWWDGVQAGVGNPTRVRDVYTLRDMNERTLRVLRTRRDIACVLINPVQGLHPNAGAASDTALISSKRNAHFDRESYRAWLQQVRQVCTDRDIPLILDDVFLGFRFAPGGTQQYLGLRADLVTYGKTLGGGLPVGVVCGRRDLMKRYRDDRPADICFARGTFNSHPVVMATMNEFLHRLDTPQVRAIYDDLEQTWDSRARQINQRLTARDLPVRVANMVSVWTTLYQVPSRYNWMFQYYLRAEGLMLGWIGTGRFLFSHDYGDADFAEVADRIVRAAEAMRADGWWWQDPGLTNASIHRRVLRETLGVKLTGILPQDAARTT